MWRLVKHHAVLVRASMAQNMLCLVITLRQVQLEVVRP